MAEAGLPGVETSLWFGLFAPTGTPRAIVDKIAVTARQAMHTEAALGTLHKLGDDPLDAGPDEFAKFMKSEIARWTKVANVAGIRRGERSPRGGKEQPGAKSIPLPPFAQRMAGRG